LPHGLPLLPNIFEEKWWDALVKVKLMLKSRAVSSAEPQQSLCGAWAAPSNPASAAVQLYGCAAVQHAVARERRGNMKGQSTI
jgi:hypothetical protein